MTTEAPPTTPTAPQHPPSPLRRVVDGLTTANTVTVTFLSLVLAMVIGAIFMIIGDPTVRTEYGYFFSAPGPVLRDSWVLVSGAYANLFRGAIVDPSAISGAIDGSNPWSQVFQSISETLTYAAPLVFTGLAVALAFRGGLFNIGAQGQATLGAIGGAIIGFNLPTPPGLHLIVALIVAAVCGALWAAIAGVLKARTGAHEVIVTIMLNSIAALFLLWIVNVKGVHNPKRSDAISKQVLSSARLPHLGGTDLRWNLGIVLGVLAVFVVAWLLSRSTLGFELRAVGANPDAARTAGMSVGRTYVLVMVIAGALAGLGGGAQILGASFPSYALTPTVMGNIGFDGITTALLGRGKPWGVFASALLFGALYAGGNRMQSFSGVKLSLVLVLQAVIVIFIAAPRLVKEIFRLREARATGVAGTLARGW